MNHIERDWITEAGLRAVCLIMLRDDSSRKHRCGYVCLPKDHPLHGKKYGEHCESLKELLERIKTTPVCEIEHLDSFPRMLAMLSGIADPRPDFVFSVHGGITYSDGDDEYPANSDGGWWYGFDCAHCDDAEIEPDTRFPQFHRRKGVVRTLEYVVGECESLASQLQLVTA